jgi:hypothetical protein
LTDMTKEGTKMRAFHWSKVFSVAALLVVITAVPGLAESRAPRADAPMRPGAAMGPAQARMPMPMLMGQRDPELTAMVRDIVILRAINLLAMNREQIEKLIPLLEQAMAADRRLRAQALDQLRQERQRLLAGTATAEQSRDTYAAMSAVRRQYADEVERLMSQAAGFLGAQQIEMVKRITMGSMQRGPGGQGAAGRREPQRRPGAADEEQELRGIGPSAEAIEHLVGLLKEKVLAMATAP